MSYALLIAAEACSREGYTHTARALLVLWYMERGHTREAAELLAVVNR